MVCSIEKVKFCI